MVMYVEHLNSKGKVIYDRQEEAYEAYLQSLKQDKQQTKAKAQDQALILTPQNTTQNILQIIPNTQNIPPPSEQSPPQNIPPLSEQSPPQNIPPLSEQSPPQNIPPLSEQSPPSTEQLLSSSFRTAPFSDQPPTRKGAWN
jgi:hypothetical protein